MRRQLPTPATGRIPRETGLLAILICLSIAGRCRAEPVQFDRDIAPILAVRCLECHNDFDRKGGLDLSSRQTARTGGDSGAVLEPHASDKSLLWQRVRDEDMPPEAPLTSSEKAILKAWIDAGALWGTDPIDVFAYSSAKRAGYDWWSLQALKRPAVPSVDPAEGSTEPRNPIDFFICSQLDRHDLTMSPPADRRTLIRRLSFDLTGLPPAPEAVEHFVADNDPGAYERLVDRLLASPAHGERWARHWLDVVRFGESQGFERDKLRDNAWRYRDWVVRALNKDLPYTEFARQQIAGDVLPQSGTDSLVATGFLVAGPWDEVGQNQQSDAMKRVVRQDELEDYISTVGQTFLGLTINCARCHDHKFDPVRQSEYYQLAAALNGVKHGERPCENDKRHAGALRSRLQSLNEAIDRLTSPIRDRLAAARRANPHDVDPPVPVARWTFDESLDDDLGGLNAQAHGNASLQKGRLRLDGKTGYVLSAPLDRDLTEKTLEVWLKLDTLQQRGGAALSLQTLDGRVFDAIVFAEKEPFRWMAGSNGFARTESFGGPEETAAQSEVVHVAITWHADGTVTAYRGGLPYGAAYKTSEPVTFRAGQAQFAFGLRHLPPGGNRFLAAQIDRAQVYDRALRPDEVAASAGVPSDFVADEEILRELDPEHRRRWEQLSFEADHVRKQLQRAQAETVYAVVPEANPSPMHVMLRGNPATPGERVRPGGVSAVLPGAADFDLESDAGDAERRRSLAEWVTRDDNPLLTRVMVNRVWQYHFGNGFVPTPSDLGFSGGQPTHPDLLDWLACEFRDSGYSLKHLHRLIVTSATYRQSSKPRPEALAIDAGNRWLWRKPPQRLDAECVRDAMLAIAGQLNQQVGGPGYYDFETYTRNTQFYEHIDPIGVSFQRRSLYRCWVRSGRSPLLDVFDCPDPSTKTPRRAVTTTPLQSLSLMNNSFVLRMADRMADRLEFESPGDAAAQVDRSFRLAYSRSATHQEQQDAAAFVADHGLPAFCRVLFNTNEFLYVE